MVLITLIKIITVSTMSGIVDNNLHNVIMEKTATLNLRVNPTVKERAEKVLSQLGVPMSTAIDMYLNQISLESCAAVPVPLFITS